MAKRLPEIRLNEEKHIICSTSVAAAQFGISRVGMDKSIKELGIAKENAPIVLFSAMPFTVVAKFLMVTSLPIKFA